MTTYSGHYFLDGVFFLFYTITHILLLVIEGQIY